MDRHILFCIFWCIYSPLEVRYSVVFYCADYLLLSCVYLFPLWCRCVHLLFCQQMLLLGYFYCLVSSARMLYAAQRSLCMVKPGRIHSSIMFSRLPPGVSWTVTGNVLPVPLSRPPNSFRPVIWCSFVYWTLLSSVLAFFCFWCSLLWFLQTSWRNLSKSVWVSLSSLFYFSVVCDGTFCVMFWDSCFRRCRFTSGERWWWCCAVCLFMYPAHIASGTLQLRVCFCRNPENDTSLHSTNGPLSCPNFTLFLVNLKVMSNFFWFFVVAN